MSRTSYLSHQGNSHRANYQDLFKTIAIILMIADHTGLYILQDLEVLRSMGRIVMPIFCFFVGYNYTKPKMRILTFGMLLSGLNYVLWNFTMLNMLVGIYFGQIVLYLLQKYRLESDQNLWATILLMVVLMQPTYELFEYGTLGTAFIVVGRLYKLGLEDPGFIPLLGILTIICGLTFQFSIQNDIIAACLVALTCYFLTLRRYEESIKVDLRYISRHSLAIYFVHVSVISAIGYILYHTR